MRNIRQCRVAIVGGAGFLGSHLVDHLVEDRGCEVWVVDNLVVGRQFVHKEAHFVHHDITTSEEFMRKLFDRELIDFVFNYAAYPYVPDSFARPKKVCDVNFMGAISVINAAQEAGVKAVLQVSSAEIYGEGYGDGRTLEQQPRLNESAPVNPHSSYGVAKAAVDNWVQVRWREAKTPCIALRQFNCVGERETHPYIVPEIISQLAGQQVLERNDSAYKGLDKFRGPTNNAGIVRLGNNSFRDFLYAGDAVKIAVELLERGQFGEVYNLGSETGIKMYDLAKLIGKLMGFADVVVEQDPARVRPWEIWHLQSDNSKIQACVPSLLKGELPWRLTSLEEALRRTIKWFEANGRKWPWQS